MTDGSTILRRARYDHDLRRRGAGHEERRGQWTPLYGNQDAITRLQTRRARAIGRGDRASVTHLERIITELRGHGTA